MDEVAVKYPPETVLALKSFISKYGRPPIDFGPDDSWRKNWMAVNVNPDNCDYHQDTLEFNSLPRAYSVLAAYHHCREKLGL